MTNLTITTAIETVTFFTIDSFINWNENENQYRIEAYKMVMGNGNEFGNKGRNAGADLFTILESLEIKA